MTPSWCREEVSEFFDRMDRDFDGRLSFGEFMGEETPLEKVFKNMDKDGDGSVSKEVSHSDTLCPSPLMASLICRSLPNCASTSHLNRLVDI